MSLILSIRSIKKWNVRNNQIRISKLLNFLLRCFLLLLLIKFAQNITNWIRQILSKVTIKFWQLICITSHNVFFSFLDLDSLHNVNIFFHYNSISWQITQLLNFRDEFSSDDFEDYFLYSSDFENFAVFFSSTMIIIEKCVYEHASRINEIATRHFVVITYFLLLTFFSLLNALSRDYLIIHLFSEVSSCTFFAIFNS